MGIPINASMRIAARARAMTPRQAREGVDVVVSRRIEIQPAMKVICSVSTARMETADCPDVFGLRRKDLERLPPR
jgi:hypothetical protein